MEDGGHHAKHLLEASTAISIPVPFALNSVTRVGFPGTSVRHPNTASELYIVAVTDFVWPCTLITEETVLVQSDGATGGLPAATHPARVAVMAAMVAYFVMLILMDVEQQIYIK